MKRFTRYQTRMSQETQWKLVAGATQYFETLNEATIEAEIIGQMNRARMVPYHWRQWENKKTKIYQQVALHVAEQRARDRKRNA